MLEILVALLIVGILAAMTGPSFMESIERNSREGAMLELITEIGVARSEAITQGRTVSICRSTNQATCAVSSGGDWDDGWIVFSDGSTAGVVDGTDALIQVHGIGNNQNKIKLQTRANANFGGDFLQFDSDGFLSNSTTGAYFKFCGQDNVQINARAIWLGNTGRPALSPPQSDGIFHDLAGANLTCP